MMGGLTEDSIASAVRFIDDTNVLFTELHTQLKVVAAGADLNFYLRKDILRVGFFNDKISNIRV